MPESDEGCEDEPGEGCRGQAADGSSKQSGQRRPQGKGGASVGLEEGMERGCTKDETLLIRSRPSDQSPHNGSYEVQSSPTTGDSGHPWA